MNANSDHIAGPISESRNFGCELVVPGLDKAGDVTILLADVSNEFIGLSLTENVGLTMRRVCAEIHDVEQIVVLRNALTSFLIRHGRE